MSEVGPYSEDWVISQSREDIMNPIIASSIAAQRQQDLLASAEHYRRLRSAARTRRTRKVSSAGTQLATPRRRFQIRPAGGRL